MAENPNLLPDEILVEIFSRLPTKSVGRCRCLSTLWRSRLSNPHFLDLHFTRKPHQQNLFLTIADLPLHQDPTYGYCYRTGLMEETDRWIYTMHLPITDESVLKKLDVPNLWLSLVGSVNGLVLIEDKLSNFVLMNPVTREQVCIPRSPFNQNNALDPRPGSRYIGRYNNRCNLDQVYGFGYDISSNDYKIVSLSEVPGVYVYSVKKGVWVRKYNFPSHINDIFWYGGNGALLNGAIHWLAFDDDESDSLAIVAFDLDSEEFRRVPAPNYTAASFCNVSVLGGCLCIIELVRLENSSFKAWMMKEYGLQESWVEFSLCDNMPGSCLAKPLCYMGEDEVVLVNKSTMGLVVSNVKDKTEKVMSSVNDAVFDGCVFVESLVSPKQLGIGTELDLS